jgi:hypothetical protein
MQANSSTATAPAGLDRQAAHSIPTSTIAWFRLAAAYLLAGVVLGVGMGVSEDFTLRSLHSHISLLGWTTLALAGLIYHVFPAAGSSRLARVHFWLYNLALPPMLVALAALLLGHPGAVPVLAASQLVVTAGVIAFVANVFLSLKRGAGSSTTRDRA